MRISVFLALIIALVFIDPAFAQKNCVKGKPCGNSCIARNKTCRIGTTTSKTTRSSNASRTTPSRNNASSTIPVGLKKEPIGCTVKRVIDGDTLECRDGKTIRLLLIDAPEMNQGDYGEKAKAALERLAPMGSTLDVLTDVDKEDRYGRLLAHLKRRSDGKLVNAEMLLQGMAVVSVYQPNVTMVDSYRTLVGLAQSGKRGLWSENAFDCLPSDFRSGDCSM